MNRLFNAFFEQPAGAGRGGGPARRWLPAMDLVETADQYVLRADLPGLSEEQVSVQLEDNVLTISGERAPEHEPGEEGFYRIERAFGAFARSLTLPAGVDPDAVSAHFDRGVLEVRVPKPEQKKPRQVQITLGDRAGEPDATAIHGTSTPQAEVNGREPVGAPA
jgi:HSP20 family protein